MLLGQEGHSELHIQDSEHAGGEEAVPYNPQSPSVFRALSRKYLRVEARLLVRFGATRTDPLCKLGEPSRGAYKVGIGDHVYQGDGL
jgi:hypothetical protein